MKAKKIKRNSVTVIGALFVFILSSGRVESAEIAIIVNSGNSNKTLSEEQLQRIFLGKESFFTSTEGNRPVARVDNALLHEEFYEKLLHRSDVQMRTYWAGQIFTGRGSPPSLLSDDDAVKKYVTQHEGAIGYVRPSSGTKGLRVVKTLP